MFISLFTVSFDVVDWFENFNLTDIKTLVNPEVFGNLLKETGYDARKTKFIVRGFTEGYSIQYQGDHKVRRVTPNLKLRIGSKLEIWNKVMKEVKDGRYAGPYENPPFEHFIQSPIGLVPKDGGAKTRLIFHLSYPRNGRKESVNANIPEELCTVQYPDFSEAVKLCVSAGVNCKIGKSDISMAFRNVPLDRNSWQFLLLKAYHPVTKKVYFFVEKCLPFGSSISCKIFQEISNAIAHIVKVKTGNRDNVNYLDDFCFVALLAAVCNWQLNQFLGIYRLINFPVVLEKTC